MGDIEALLENHFERLSELENKVINWLSTQNEPIDISQKPADIELSNARFLQIIQSLTPLSALHFVIREYFHNLIFYRSIKHIFYPSF